MSKGCDGKKGAHPFSQRAAGRCKAAADASYRSFLSRAAEIIGGDVARVKGKEGASFAPKPGGTALQTAPLCFCMGDFSFYGGMELRIGILGGSFDPPHSGHHYLGVCLREKLRLDKLLIIPAGQPPHKEKRIRISDEDRLRLCQLVFPENYFQISQIEMKREGKSYTIDTLTELRKELRRDELFLLVGADMLLYFDRWYRWRDILANCTLCAIARDNEHDAQQLRRYADEVLGGHKVQILSVPPLPVSSTEIRRKIAAGESIDGLMPPQAAAYIKQKRLYCEQ